MWILFICQGEVKGANNLISVYGDFPTEGGDTLLSEGNRPEQSGHNESNVRSNQSKTAVPELIMTGTLTSAHLIVVEGVVHCDVSLHGDGDGHEDGARHGDHVTGVQHVL